MCTVTWTHRAADAPDLDPKDAPAGADGGYRLWFNRDELRSRGGEVPPSIQRTPEGVQYISPADSDAGGTWITVNELGVTVALLNGYRVSRGPEPESWTSRGHLVRSLAGLTGPRAAWSRLSPALLAPFRPAVIVIVPPRGESLVARWDGLDLAMDVQGERQLPITSSSYKQEEVQQFRRGVYGDLVGADETAPPTPATLEAFQRFVGPEGPTAYTPSMARPDAATRSQCAITVGSAGVQFDYRAKAPHESGDPDSTLRMDRVLRGSAGTLRS